MATRSASSNLTLSIPNLNGGVSQQAAPVRSSTQCEVMENALPSPVEGLTKRHPTQRVTEIRKASTAIYSGVTETSIKPHLITRDQTEKYFVFINPAASSATSLIEVYDLAGTKKTVNYEATAQDYLINATRSTLKLLTVADVTFVVNTAKVTALDTATTTAINYKRIALVYIKQSNSNRDTSITVSDTNGANSLTVTHSTAATNLGTDHVATALAASLNAQNPGGASAYTAVASDSVIKITRGSDFNITADDDFGGQGAYLIRNSVQRFEDLPQASPQGHIVKVAGVPESSIDDYYVKFETVDATGFTKGIWRETVAPAIKYAFNYATMPHILIRQSDGTFLFKMANGTTPGGLIPAGADYSAYQWATRKAGDDATNSSPTFVGMTISNIVLFKNRLGVTSEENIILSEVSEFFNFWRTTVLDLPDGDPIDIASSNSKIGKINSGLVFNTELILFTDSSQLAMRGGEILSAKSVALLPVGDYENYSDIQPTSSGLSVYFPYNRGGGFAGIRELVPQANIDGYYDVNTLTDVVPSYISSKPVHIAASAQEEMLAVVSNGDLYLYKYLKGQQGLLQASWFKYNFPDNSTSGFAKVIWAEFVYTELYVLVLRSNSANPVLEKIRLGVDLNDSDTVAGSNWTANLDARVYYTTGTYNSTTGLTTWNLAKPYSYVAGKTAVYTTNGLSLTVVSGTSYNQGSDAVGTVAVRGDYSATPVWVGYRYTMKFQFSEFWLLGPAGRGEAALQTGRYTLKNISLLFADTAYFRLEVVTGAENTYTYDYSGTVLATSVLNQIYLNSGTYRIPVYGRNTSTRITITNDSALPSKFISAEVEGDYTSRASRFG
jgi:hypothetical protein